MRSRHAFVALLAPLMGLLAMQPHAQDWGDIGIISSTLGNNAGRLCAGAPSEKRLGDLGCPSYAPSITTAGDVSVTGNLSAAQFIGDGSLLTGLSGGDRITSGTSSVTVNGTTNTISFTTNGTTNSHIRSNGWFHGPFFGDAVNTNGIFPSGSNLYFMPAMEGRLVRLMDRG